MTFRTSLSAAAVLGLTLSVGCSGAKDRSIAGSVSSSAAGSGHSKIEDENPGLAAYHKIIPISGEGDHALSDEEWLAGAQAVMAWKIAKIGDSHYFHYRPHDEGEAVYLELRGAKIRVHSERLTEADKLNGIKWAGYVEVEGSAVRTYEGNMWSDWKSRSPSNWIEPMSLTETDKEWLAFVYFKGSGRTKDKYPSHHFNLVSAGEVPK